MSIKFINKGGGKTVLPDGTRFSGSTFTNIDLSQFDTSNVTSMTNMFSSCTSLTSIDLSVANTSNISSIQSIFQNCTLLTSANLSNIDISNVTSMTNMFSGCTSLTSIDLSNIDTSNVSDMTKMFYNCSNLTTIYGIENFDLGSLTSSTQSMFSNCSNLTKETLNNVLKALSTATFNSVARKNLKRICDLTEEQANICTTLSNWAACQEVGWSTGY